MRTRRKFPLLRSSHHDFNQYVWPPEWSLDADTYGKVLSVHPFVPNGIVVLKIPPIRQPYVSGQEFRFVGASCLKKPVDGFQHLLSLHFYIAGRLGRHAAGTNNPVVHHDQADERDYFHAIHFLYALGCPNPLNGHSLVSFSERIGYADFSEISLPLSGRITGERKSIAT